MMAGIRGRDPKASFDVVKYAESLTPRERQTTIADAETTEQARIASVLMDSNPPQPARASLQPHASQADVALYRSRLAPMTRVPKLARKLTELGASIEDPKSAFVLGFVDGLLPLETIIEVAGLPELETLRILDRAIAQGAISFNKI